MAVYTDREAVLLQLGGTLREVQARFDRTRWTTEPVESVTVASLTFDVPTSILEAIDQQIVASSSLVDSHVLQAYKSLPTTMPGHIRDDAAQLVATRMLRTDGVKADIFKEMRERAERFLRRLSKCEIDLGIEQNRPRYRKPGIYVAQGVGTARRAVRGRANGQIDYCDPCWGVRSDGGCC